MIKFEILSAEGAESFVLGAVERFGFSAEELSEVVGSFLEMSLDEDIEVGLTVSRGCVLARVFDMGRYMFVYPIEMSEESSAELAIEDIREYAVLEELPLVITDIPCECIGALAGKFNHTVIDRECGESFRLEARSECALLRGEWPEVTYGGLTLCRPRERDIPLIARLNRDPEVNKYWGYDVISDLGEVEDGYFAEYAEHEFNMGTSLSLAVILDGGCCGDADDGARERGLGEMRGDAGDGVRERGLGEYVGEVILYGFDLSGGAEFAVRILPEYQGRGLGSGAVEALFELCSEIGISRLFGRVDEKNLPSVKLLDKYFERHDTKGEIIYYEREIG